MLANMIWTFPQNKKGWEQKCKIFQYSFFCLFLANDLRVDETQQALFAAREQAAEEGHRADKAEGEVARLTKQLEAQAKEIADLKQQVVDLAAEIRRLSETSK